MAFRYKDRPLEDVVAEFSDEEMLYIGSSSSYFFIGTKVEFDALIDLISENTLLTAQKNLLTAKKYVDPIISKINALEPSSSLVYYTSVRDLCNTAFNNVQTVCSYLAFIETFSPLRYRRVKEVERMKETNGFRILVNGKEQSRYWFKDEFDREWVKKGDSHDYEFTRQKDIKANVIAPHSRNNTVSEVE